jgi:hypothetical protein
MEAQVRRCVICGQQLAGGSKLTEVTVPIQEALERRWIESADEKEMAVVAMCMQCQITLESKEARLLTNAG